MSFVPGDITLDDWKGSTPLTEQIALGRRDDELTALEYQYAEGGTRADSISAKILLKEIENRRNKITETLDA